MRSRARWNSYVQEDGSLVLQDIGPWNTCPTITNDVENVVYDLAHVLGRLKPGQRLFYYDSEGVLDEIIHEGGKFVRFGPARPR